MANLLKDYFLIKKSGYFDSSYYLRTYTDVRVADIDPLFHFVKTGWKEGRNPSSSFNTTRYMQDFPELLNTHINPLVHFICREKEVFRSQRVKMIMREKENLILKALAVAREEGWSTVFKKVKNKIIVAINTNKNTNKQSKLLKYVNQSIYQDIYTSYLTEAHNTTTHPEYVTLSDIDLSGEMNFIKLIAFYLPQYHPIPENDAWWGKGFTEWVNVSKAVPQFVGHYQPHHPGELGYYDLRIQEVQRRQVELAKKYGVSGFCFYYYWFNGKKLLDMPLDHFTSDTTIEFPFCLCWANENWTRRWDGLDEEVLIAQNHSEEADLAFIRDVEKYLKNKNYIRIGGRPILLIYRAQLIPNFAQTVQKWRQYCKEIGLGDIYLIVVQTPGVNDPRAIGVDAAVEFPPHGLPPIPTINGALSIANKDFSGHIFDYWEVAKSFMEKSIPEYPLFKTVCLSWDNTARRQNNPSIFHNCTPMAYRIWLSSAAEYTCKCHTLKEKFVFINAWNEWAEGTHLEPDRKFGYAYLQATADVVHIFNKIILEKKKNTSNPLIIDFKKKHDTAVILHLYYSELWDEISSYLDNLAQDFDLFVSIPKNMSCLRDKVLLKFSEAFIFECENRGRDIAPFIRIFSEIIPFDYRYICKIHTKKSVHRKDGSCWRDKLLSELLGSEREIQEIKRHLDLTDVGIIGPKGNLLSTEHFIGGNQTLINILAEKLNLLYFGEPFPFVAGSMFWCKPEAISSITRLNLSEDDFGVEVGALDATLAHALERFISLLAIKNGYRILQTGTFSEDVEKKYQYALSSINRRISF